MTSKRIIEAEQMTAFKQHLFREERSHGTVEKYLRDVRSFAVWLESRPVSKETVSGWKNYLIDKGYAPVTINSMLSAVNSFLKFAGWDECRAKFLKIQRRLFRDKSRELTRTDYDRLITRARELEKDRLALLMETICATGIRVSEVRYITLEAARQGRAEISLKGKIRTILLPGKLCRKLLKYAKEKKISFGEIFITKGGTGISRRQIWSEMKWLCRRTGIEESRVFPHNLRHLFARTFYKVCKDITQLADVLGHSCIETTRIYLLTTGAEHNRQLERLGLVS